MYKNKTVVVGISGGIAAYKSASLVSMLVKSGAEVHVIMTKNACNFISPLTFETLTSNKCLVDTFDRNFVFDVEHIALAKKANVFVVAPATANIIAKFANGIADDMLTTTFLASNCHKIIAPAMNTNMYENPITQDNINKLRNYKIEIIEPISGLLACGDIGAGKMEEPENILMHIKKSLYDIKDCKGKNILVTAGATREAIDPVRYITNHSTGKMGYALANECMLRGGNVTLVTAAATVDIPKFVTVKRVANAKEMYDVVTQIADEQDIIIKAAAVSDYTPKEYAKEKIKKKESDMSISMEKTNDILKALGESKKEGQYICGFSMETENMIENSQKKLIAKNADMIIANNLNVEGAGFAGDTNVVTIITKEKQKKLPLLTKEEVSKEIVDEILKNL